LIRIRKQRGFTLDALGERINYARPNLIAWEKGRVSPSAARLVELAQVLGIEPWQLTTRTPRSAELVDLRVWAGLTQRQLADRAGIPRSSYSVIERGGAAPSRDVLARLAAAIGRDERELQRASRRTTARAPRGR